MNRQDEEYSVEDCPCVICGKLIPFTSYWRPCCGEEHFYEYWSNMEVPSYLKRKGNRVVRIK
jgi:hypothetical protein